MSRHCEKHFIRPSSFTFTQVHKDPVEKVVATLWPPSFTSLQLDILVWPGHVIGKINDETELPDHSSPTLKNAEVTPHFNYLIEGQSLSATNSREGLIPIAFWVSGVPQVAQCLPLSPDSAPPCEAVGNLACFSIFNHKRET